MRFLVVWIFLFLTLVSAQEESIAEKRWSDYRRFMEKTALLSKQVQLEEINGYFNQIVNELDSLNWGEEDYWSTPKEFIIRGKGDCEDFVIAKYFALKELGFDASQMMIIIVKVDNLQELHAVLGVKNQSGEILILDNLSWKILPITKRRDLKIVKWVNESSLKAQDQRLETIKFLGVIQKIKNER
ncbi:MAG: transglutaminase-like cysteine peptidase [Sulfurimonas sp.]|uniref:transglutaminase-like cysteine peptidase n=1 Tax=Sulfurimonas sp. TaxID=2022749 RepID=UPI002628E271|nr:transglutaminase-like cysteine peptidase [Sulfurimonas sp.]MDD2651502.1 transglutaminase-like cysteine peptidase [Sulfurimonas sp.]MDD3451043.1 transglutaminase-like cysteine peptidase [Sulfurimonas sp.]